MRFQSDLSRSMNQRMHLIDVVMCTWNSNKPYFERCLKSIKREIPIHCIIVIDRFSSDGTVDVIRKYFNPKVVLNNENLAKARATGIKLVDTEYFVFIDDDIELPKGWFKRVVSYMDQSVGAIHELLNPNPVVAKWLQFLEEWTSYKKKSQKRCTVVDVTIENASKRRGYTHNTIVKADLAKDWRPSSSVSAYEDWLLMKHIVTKGYVWRIINNCNVIHYPNLKGCTYENIKRVRWNNAGARITGYLCMSPAQLFVRCFNIKRKAGALFASVKFREPRILLYSFFEDILLVDAYIRWNKFLVMER